MNLDDRLRHARQWLDATSSQATPDLGDLDRRRQRHQRHRTTAITAVIFVTVAAGALALLAARNSADTTTVAAGTAAQSQPAQVDPSPDAVEGPAFVLPDPPDGWEQFAPTTTDVDHSPVLAGEDFAQVYVRFDTEQDPYSAHDGSLAGTIRVAVGTYDDTIGDLFDGASTSVTIGDREFELIETGTDGIGQVALVPVDVSERTFVLVGRGIDTDTALAMAQPIDPTRPIPRIGAAPDGFIVLYSGPPEFSVLDTGTAVHYQSADGDQTFTITTYHGVAISCFANAWAYPNTEITRIGGDTGVLAQLDGQPGGTGTYRALWNRGHDTLIGVTATGIDRNTLIDLADQLVLDDNATGYQTHLELAA